MERERNGFERATSIRLPFRSVDGCHRPLVGNSNFKSRFRDYSAGNESAKGKERRKKRREREREREKRRQSRRESNGSVTGGDYSSGISVLPLLVDLGKVFRIFLNINSFGRVGDVARHVTFIAVWNYQRRERERKVWAVLSKPACNKSLRREIKGEQFRS